MNTKHIAAGVLTAIMMTGGAIGLASAQSTSTAPAPAITEAQAIEAALAEVPGEVVEAELEREDGEQYYEIEIVNAEGVETDVEIDAETGAVIEVAADESDDDDDGDCDKDRDSSAG